MTRRPRAYITDGSEMLIGIGSAHGVLGPEEEPKDVAGRLYVPDPEMRHGWREFYVHRPTHPKPGARPIGFGRP